MKLFSGNTPTKEFFLFLKYNTIIKDEEPVLSETDEILYNEFISKIETLTDQLEDSQNNAKATASSLFSMFGFTRHYCSMTGQPIIGKYYKIGGKIVSKEAYEAHKIIQEIEKKEEAVAQKKAESMAKKSEDK